MNARSLARAAALGVVGAACLAVPGAASAANPLYADFAQCNTTATSDFPACLVADTTSGSIKLGNQTVPINKRIRLQGTFSNGFSGNTTLYPPKNGQTLERTALDVPGGLLGIMDTGNFNFFLLQAFQRAVRAANGVTATAELVGQPRFSYEGFFNREGTAVTLPTRIKLDNPFLGSNCYIGSASSPVTFRLTTGTTTPPAGVAPLTGSPGTFVPQDNGNIVLAQNYSLVDNTFTAPKASGCGNIIIDQPLITGAVNLKIGLPSGAGRNSATFKGNAKIADAAAVTANR